MGRPIKARYFLRGGKVPSQTSFNKGWIGLSGSVTTPGAWYPQGTYITFPQGQLGSASTTAQATLTISTSTGAVTGITMTNVGSGYNSTVTNYTITQPATVTSTVNGSGPVTATNTFTVGSAVGIQIGMLISGAATGYNGHVQAVNGNVITSTVNNNGTWTNASNLTFSSTGSGAVLYFNAVTPADTGLIATTAYISSDTQGRAAAIVKQEGSHRYLVEADVSGTLRQGICKLASTSTLTAGLMTITALDTNGSSYFVTKLTDRKARIVQYAVSGSFVFASGSVVKWNTSGAGTNTVQVVTNAN